MNATTVAVDLAKSVFQMAMADEHWSIKETRRLTRTQFERQFANRAVSLVFGVAAPVGARTGLEAISPVLAEPGSAVPELIRGKARLLVE